MPSKALNPKKTSSSTVHEAIWTEIWVHGAISTAAISMPGRRGTASVNKLKNAARVLGDR
jgi:hypothetical protein